MIEVITHQNPINQVFLKSKEPSLEIGLRKKATFSETYELLKRVVNARLRLMEESGDTSFNIKLVNFRKTE